jgi:hypothetical protein
MIHNDWLGYYWNTNDGAFDERMHRLRLFVSASDALCFEYYYESRSNHGYDIAFQGGTVRSVSGSELAIHVTCWHEDSWEDWFKEHRLETHTTSRVRTIGIKSIRENRPSLIYEDVELWFKCTDSLEDSSLFAKVRAEVMADLDRLNKQGETPDA